MHASDIIRYYEIVEQCVVYTCVERRTVMGKKPIHETKSIIKGAFILTIAAMVTKILSAIYRVPFQNIVGDVGFYMYQQVYPFYGIAVVLTTYGFPVIISKLYAEFSECGNTIALKKLIDASKIVLMTISIILFIGLFFGADWIASKMGDVNLALLIQVVSFVYLFMPFIAIMRGINQGKGDMVPTAVSQVGEQFFRVASILVFSFFLVKEGYALYVTGAGAVLGSVIGGCVSTFILFAFKYRNKQKKLAPNQQFVEQTSVTTKSLTKTVFIEGFAICISGLLLIFIQLADSLNLYALLTTTGMDTTAAKAIKGVYDRGQPLIQLGTVVATSISLAMIPFISRINVRKDKVVLADKIRLALQLSIVFGLGASTGLASIIVPTNIMLFQNSNGSDVLAVLALQIVLASIIMTITAILQGLGYMFFPAVIVFIGAVIKYSINYLFVPAYGTIGAAWSSMFSLMIVLGLLAIKLMRVTNKKVWGLNMKFLVITGLATIVMTVLLNRYLYVTQFVLEIVNSVRLASAIQALSAVCIGGFVYILIIIKGGLFNQEELRALPFGSKLVLLLPKK